MHGIAHRIGSYIAKEMANSEAEDVISYGVEIVLGVLFQFIVILGTAACLGVFQAVSAVLFSAVIFRIFSGGGHCTGYYRCLMVSIFTFIPLGYLAYHLADLRHNQLIMVIGTLFVVIFTLMWAPAENPKHPIGGKNKRYRLKIICLILIAVFILMLVGFGAGIIISGIFVGLLWQTFTITPLGTAWLHRADRLLIIMATLLKRKEGAM